MDLSTASPAIYGLTEGVISVILDQVRPTKPRVQLLDFKEIGRKGGDANLASKRYRLMISDGRNKFAFVMIPSHMVRLIDNGTITNFSIVELVEYFCNIETLNNMERKILIITDMCLVRAGDEIGGIIGTPTLIPDPGNQNGRVAMQPAAVKIPLNQGAVVERPLILETNQSNRSESPKHRVVSQSDAGFGASFPKASPGRTQNGGRSFVPVDNEGFVEDVRGKDVLPSNSATSRCFSPATARLACCFTVSTTISYPANSIPNSRKINFRIRPANKSGKVPTDESFRMAHDDDISATNSSPPGNSFSLQVTVIKSKSKPRNLPQIAPGLTNTKQASRNSGESKVTGDVSSAVVSDCAKISKLRTLLKSVNSCNYMEISVLITDMPCYSNEQDVKQVVDALLDEVQGQDPESDQSHVYASLCCDLLNFLLRQNKVLAAKFKSSLLWTTQNRLCNLTNDKRQFDADKFPLSEQDAAREQFGTLKRFAVLLESEGIMSPQIAVLFRPWLTKVKVVQSDKLKLPAFQNSDEDGKRGF